MKLRKIIKIISTIFYLLLLSSTSFCLNDNSRNIVNSSDLFLKKADSLMKVSSYDSAIFFYRKVCILNIRSENWDVILNCNLQIAQCFQIKGNFDSTFFYLNNAKNTLERIINPNSNMMCTYFYLMGSTFIKIAEIDSAVYYLNKSIDLFSGEVTDSLQVQVIRTLGNANYSQGKHNEALILYKEALNKELKRKGSSEITLAAIFQNIGIIYSTFGEYDSAQIYLIKSIDLKEKFLDNNDPQLALGYLNYGRFLYIIGNSDEAISYLSKAENIYISNYGIDYSGLAPIYFNKGSILISQRDFNKALNFHERARELYLNSPLKNSSVIVDIAMNLGVIYEQKKEFEKAIYFFKESLIETSNSESKIKSLRSLARCYQYKRDYYNAEKYFKMAIQNSEELFGKDHNLTAGSYIAYGDYLASIGNFNRANEYLYEAYKIKSKKFGNKNSQVSLILSRMGDLYSNLNEYGKALEYYQEAIIAVSKEFINKNKETNPSLYDLNPEFNNFALLYKKAYALYDYYTNYSNDHKDLKCSYETGKLAIELFEKILAAYHDEETKIIVNDYIYDIYNLVILIAADLYSYYGDKIYLNSAFEYTEKSKSAILLSSVRGLEAIEIGTIPIVVRKKETELKRELSLLNTLVNDENQKSQPDSLKISAWKKRIFTRNLSYDSLMADIEHNYPEYYNLKYNIGVINAAETEIKLKSDEILIEYKLIDSLLLVFSINQEGINLDKIILDDEFNHNLMNFIVSINQFPSESFRKEDYVEFIYRANDLCQTLLSPVFQSKELKKIIVVPDNILGYLPFEVLINNYQVPDKIDFKNLNYLIRSYTISYAYSSTLLFKHFTQSKINSKLLAVAPTYNNKNSGNGTESFAGERNMVDNLKSLTYSLDEVRNINSIINGKILSGEGATENNFKKEAGNFGILHLAMHTLINDSDPLTSKLVFTLVKDTIEDGFLNAYEVYNLKLNAALAVLSACNTGSGKFSRGEGIMSIARGFLYAGVHSVVMTLWEVEDASGSEIMFQFYKYLKTGADTDIALKNAKLAYLESADPLQSHPYFWAAYVQIGKTDPVLSNTPSKIILVSISVMAIVLIGLYLRKYYKRKSKKIS